MFLLGKGIISTVGILDICTTLERAVFYGKPLVTSEHGARIYLQTKASRIQWGVLSCAIISTIIYIFYPNRRPTLALRIYMHLISRRRCSVTTG